MGWAHLFSDLQKLLSSDACIHCLGNCYFLYISGMILWFVCFQVGDYIHPYYVGRIEWSFFLVNFLYHPLILWTILVFCWEISSFPSWLNLGFSNLYLKKLWLINKQQLSNIHEFINQNDIDRIHLFWLTSKYLKSLVYFF